MLLIPYFWNTTGSKQLGLFLSKGGNSVWNLDKIEAYDEIIKILEENEFPPINIKYGDRVAYAEIDFKQLCLSDFYLSTDPGVSEKDVWHIIDIPDSVMASDEFKSICMILTGRHLN